MGERYVAAIDVGGTKMLSGLISDDGRLLCSRRVPSNARRGADAVVADIAGTLRALIDAEGMQSGQIAAIGCSVPGPLDRRRGVVTFSPNLDWHEYPLRDALANYFSQPILIDDDANCAALGEGWRGAAADSANFLYVTVSTGVGAGVVIDNRVYHGVHDVAGEAGHMVIEPNGPTCSCGNTGCLEALCSGTSIAARARDALRHGEETQLRAMVGARPKSLSSEMVFAAAAQGDVVAREILATAGLYLGIGLANLATLFDPEMIVLGGGVLDGGDAMLGPVRTSFMRRALPSVRATPLRPALLGSHSALVGAGRLAMIGYAGD